MRNKKYKKSLGTVLPELVQHKGWREKLDLHSFFPKWEKVVAEHVSACSKPLKIVRGVLWLEVESSSWMQQLQYDKYQILDDINRTLTCSRVGDIKFVLPTAKKEPSYSPPHVTFVSPKPEEVKKFEEQVGVIQDEAIREAMVRLWYLSRACRREEGK